MSATKICMHCLSHIPTGASVCPQCTRDTSVGEPSGLGVVIILGLFLFFIVKGCVEG